jgi:hypothetical protein
MARGPAKPASNAGCTWRAPRERRTDGTAALVVGPARKIAGVPAVATHDEPVAIHQAPEVCAQGAAADSGASPQVRRGLPVNSPPNSGGNGTLTAHRLVPALAPCNARQWKRQPHTGVLPFLLLDASSRLQGPGACGASPWFWKGRRR